MATYLAAHPRKKIEVEIDSAQSSCWLSIEMDELEIVIHSNRDIAMSAIVAKFRAAFEKAGV